MPAGKIFNTVVGAGANVTRLVGMLLVMDSTSSVEVDGSSVSLSSTSVGDETGVVDLVGVLVDLVEDLVGTGVESRIGESLETVEPVEPLEPVESVVFWQSFLISLHSYPKSQHNPDEQMGPPLQDPPLHMG